MGNSHKSSAVTAILVRGLKCQTQFWKGTTQGSFQQSLVEIGSVVSEEKIKPEALKFEISCVCVRACVWGWGWRAPTYTSTRRNNNVNIDKIKQIVIVLVLPIKSVFEHERKTANRTRGSAH
jgi:hypothetical protein